MAGGAPDALTVLTWNVENYVAEDRMVEGEYRTEYPKPEAAKAALRAALRALSPDVLALQEMGPEPYLAELQRDLAAEGKDFCAFGFFSAEFGKFIRAVTNDKRDDGQSFNIVDNRRFLPQALNGRERRAGARLAALTFDRIQKSRFFTADKGAGA